MASRSTFDWTLFGLLALLWASAFGLTKVAVDGLPAGTIVFARLAIGAGLMMILMVIQGERFPPLNNRRAWSTIVAMGVVGTAAPFYVLTIAQKDIDSALAALLISSTPLFVASLAHYRFADEQMSWNKTAGIAVGFVGVGVLFGPDAMSGWADSSVIAQLLVLAGGFCYAINTIIARGAPPISPAVLPAGFLGFAALASLPLAIFADYSQLSPSAIDVAAVVALGAFPTAGAGWLLMFLVARTSATFIALTGYIIPLFAAVIGYVFLKEQIGWDMALALGLILAGVWLAQRPSKGRAITPTE
ncbi:MAG: DMT family transporter [Pseudomonadota bacterium]